VKERFDKLDFIKIVKNVCSAKDTVKKIKRQEQTRRKYFQNISVKALVSKICKNSKNSTIRKQTTQFKNGSQPLTDTSPKKICRWQSYKHTKRCQQQMQIKTMSAHYRPIRLAKIQTLTAPNAGEDIERRKK
jgi:hypothetical protein